MKQFSLSDNGILFAHHLTVYHNDPKYLDR